MGVEDRGVNGVNEDNPKNSGHVLRNSMAEVFLLACVIQNGLETGKVE